MTNEWPTIEGETPIDDLSFLRDRSSIRTRDDLNKAEADNVRKAHLKYLGGVPTKRTAPFTYDWMLSVHKAMFCDVWKWAGKLRQVDTQIGAPHHLIGERLGGLEMDIAAWQEDESLLIEQAVMMHYRSVHIHPFCNGNGRWARLLASIWLKRQGKPPIAWPDSELGASESLIRVEYLAAIKSADAGDFFPLTELHLRYWPG